MKFVIGMCLFVYIFFVSMSVCCAKTRGERRDPFFVSPRAAKARSVRTRAPKQKTLMKKTRTESAPKVRGIIAVGEKKNALIYVGGQSSVAGVGDIVAGYKILCLSMNKITVKDVSGKEHQWEISKA